VTELDSCSAKTVDLLADDGLRVLVLRTGVAALSTPAVEGRLDLVHHDSSNGCATLAMLDPSEVMGRALDFVGV
jgi:hypothetical protein